MHRMIAQAPVDGIVGGLEAMIARPDSTPTLRDDRRADADRRRRGGRDHAADGRARAARGDSRQPPRGAAAGRASLERRAAGGVQHRRERIPRRACCTIRFRAMSLSVRFRPSSATAAAPPPSRRASARIGARAVSQSQLAAGSVSARRAARAGASDGDRTGSSARCSIVHRRVDSPRRRRRGGHRDAPPLARRAASRHLRDLSAGCEIRSTSETSSSGWASSSSPACCGSCPSRSCCSRSSTLSSSRTKRACSSRSSGRSISTTRRRRRAGFRVRPREPERGPHDWGEAWRSEISTFLQYGALGRGVRDQTTDLVAVGVVLGLLDARDLPSLRASPPTDPLVTRDERACSSPRVRPRSD